MTGASTPRSVGLFCSAASGLPEPMLRAAREFGAECARRGWRLVYGGSRVGLMGEAGPEAILPLKRGSNGKLGVEGGGSNVSVVINNHSGAPVSQRETADARGNRRIEVMIGEMVAGEMSRPGSAAHSSVRNSFGYSPRLVGR